MVSGTVVRRSECGGQPRRHTVQPPLEWAGSFYRSAFGWSFKQWGDDYIDTKDSGVGCGVNGDPEHRTKAPLAVIFATHLEAAAQRVISAGGTMTRAVFAFPGGRRFHFRDPAGNEVADWSEK